MVQKLGELIITNNKTPTLHDMKNNLNKRFTSHAGSILTTTASRR